MSPGAVAIASSGARSATGQFASVLGAGAGHLHGPLQPAASGVEKPPLGRKLPPPPGWRWKAAPSKRSSTCRVFVLSSPPGVERVRDDAAAEAGAVERELAVAGAARRSVKPSGRSQSAAASHQEPTSLPLRASTSQKSVKSLARRRRAAACRRSTPRRAEAVSGCWPRRRAAPRLRRLGGRARQRRTARCRASAAPSAGRRGVDASRANRTSPSAESSGRLSASR